MQKTSGFQFVDHIIRKSIFLKTSGNSKSNYDIDILPSGILNIEKNEFQLSLEVVLSNKKEESLINVDIVGLFKYSGELEEVKPFLYLNGPAILFPYLRAYISALTSLSGIETFTLPTMNLSGLKGELESKVQVLNKSEIYEDLK